MVLGVERNFGKNKSAGARKPTGKSVKKRGGAGLGAAVKCKKENVKVFLAVKIAGKGKEGGRWGLPRGELAVALT